MTIKAPLVGENILLQYLVGLQTAPNFEYRLFTNNYTLADNTVLATLVQCSSAGYSALTLTSASWGVSNIAGVETATYATAITWSLTSSDTIYGYYVLGGGNLLFGENFSGGPFVFGAGGGSVVLNKPQITMTS